MIWNLDLHVSDEPLQQHVEFLASSGYVWKKTQGVNHKWALLYCTTQTAYWHIYNRRGVLIKLNILPSGYKRWLTKWTTPFVAILSDSETRTEFTCMVLFAWRRQLHKIRQENPQNEWLEWACIFKYEEWTDNNVSGSLLALSITLHI